MGHALFCLFLGNLNKRSKTTGFKCPVNPTSQKQPFSPTSHPTIFLLSLSLSLYIYPYAFHRHKHHQLSSHREKKRRKSSAQNRRWQAEQLGLWQPALEQWRLWRIKASADGTTLWDLFTSMPRTILGPSLNLRPSLLLLLHHHLLLLRRWVWILVEKMRKGRRRQRKHGGKSCTWTPGVPTEAMDLYF